MSRTHAEQLAKAVASIETAVNEIEALVDISLTQGDFNFVSDFRDARGATLQESGLIMGALVKRMQGKLNELASVLYLRELESIKEPVHWRHEANAGKRVAAIVMLRNFADGKLSIDEARDILDAYSRHQF